jgi:uncharacterized protein YcbX
MSVVGKVESLWRYPVKSMRGEEVNELFAGFSGIYGDRLFAFHSSASPKGFPYLTARDQRQMIRYRPRFRHPDKAAAPVNLTEAQSMPPGATPVYADATELMLDVETPAGNTVALDDPALIDMLRAGIDDKHQLTLVHSARAMTDCRPLSLLSLQSVHQLADETGIKIDKLRFRTNIYLDLSDAEGFSEDSYVGRSLRIGSQVTLSILERDPRCMLVTLDPDTAEKTPVVLKQVVQAHDGKIGVYGAVLVEGTIRKGDPVELLD